ncbi:DUF4956 domain-containing protein [Magnetococcales bacterium HHB-1]
MMQQNLIEESLAFVYEPHDIMTNLVLAFALGMIISAVYKRTHKGLSYSQSFMLTLVFISLIVSMVMMVIGNNLARAFALVGALSIIRFRTVVKDTKDTSYVFMSLAAGMSAGTSSYFLAIAGTSFMVIVAWILHWTNYGAFYKSEFILRFRSTLGKSSSHYDALFEEFAKSSDLLHVEPSGDHNTLKLTFDIVMKKDQDPKVFSQKIAAIEGVSEVILVASKSDVDY